MQYIFGAISFLSFLACIGFVGSAELEGLEFGFFLIKIGLSLVALGVCFLFYNLSQKNTAFSRGNSKKRREIRCDNN